MAVVLVSRLVSGAFQEATCKMHRDGGVTRVCSHSATYERTDDLIWLFSVYFLKVVLTSLLLLLLCFYFLVETRNGPPKAACTFRYFQVWWSGG